MSQTVVTPLDVRLMQIATILLYVVLFWLVLSAAARWVALLPAFQIRAIEVVGDVEHHNAVTLRANINPYIAGSLFSLDLGKVRTAFQALPWVRKAVVHRVFPNRLKIRLEEHQAVAYWGSDSDARLLNSFGEVFEANTGDLEQLNLPRLIGPEGQSAEVLAMHRHIAPHYAQAALPIEELQLTSRGSWRARLVSGAELEMGRSGAAEIEAASLRFLQTVSQVTSRYDRPNSALKTVDLRHPNGYAIQIHGVSTLLAQAPTSPRN
jgi:cell division protein FtsQ